MTAMVFGVGTAWSAHSMTQLLADHAAAEFEAVVMERQLLQPRRRATHPYFSFLTLPELVKLCTVHARHHMAFLPNGTPLANER